MPRTVALERAKLEEMTQSSTLPAVSETDRAENDLPRFFQPVITEDFSAAGQFPNVMTPNRFPCAVLLNDVLERTNDA
jgi:hypothetical protein